MARKARAAVFAETLFLAQNEVLAHGDEGERVHAGLMLTKPFFGLRRLRTTVEGAQPPPVEVWNTDTVSATLDLARAHPDKRVCVLNMASERVPGGGVRSGANAQEECLCRCSTLYISLTRNPRFYPLAEEGGLYSPDVLFFRDAEHRILDWKDCVFADVVSVAAIRRPELVDGGLDEDDRALTYAKILGLLRSCAHNGARILVLGAAGCGAFKNPPEDIAQLFRSALSEIEFHGRFERVVFAIIDNEETNNYATFRAILHPLAPPDAPRVA